MSFHSPSQKKDPAGASHLLLYSLAEFSDLIEQVLEAKPARGVCEVGVEAGRFSDFLGGYCTRRGIDYLGVDPLVSDEFVSRHATERVTLLRGYSHDILPEVTQHDVFFLDGDHNYFTVYGELSAIYRGERADRLVFLHDVGWPWARRDQYCDPLRIPASARHPHRSDAGAEPGKNELVEGRGFIGQESDYFYAAALKEGGEKTAS